VRPLEARLDEKAGAAETSPLDSLSEAFFSHLLHVREFSPQTVRTYRAALQDFFRSLEISDAATVTARDVDRYLTRCGLRGLGPNTRRTRLNALRTFFKWLVRRGEIASNPTEGALGPSAKDLDRIPVLSAKEIDALLFSYREPPLVRGKREPAAIFRRRERVAAMKISRDTAMLALAYSQGLRASELGRLQLSDYKFVGQRPALILRESKWAREPVARLIDPMVRVLLDSYLYDRNVAGIRHDALFPPLAFRRRDTRDPGLGVGRSQIAAVLARRVRVAGIEPAGRRLSPHALRYSVATHLYDGGMRSQEIRVFMRHRSIETLRRYLRLGSERQIQGRAIRFLPWNRRRRHPSG